MSNFHNKTPLEIFKQTNSSSNGLSTSQALIRLKKNGYNELPDSKKTNYFLKFLSQFKDIMVIILLVAAVISLTFAMIQNSKTELIDALIIFVIVLINATLSFIQEIKAENALESLKKLSQPYSKVIRDNEEKKVKTNELVVGDIVLLEAGDVVPADIFLLESASLKVDESSLTGESIQSEKVTGVVLPEKTSLADRKNMCFSSTIVAYGRAKGIVVSTGKNAEIGKIASLINEEKEETTPLEASLNKLGEVITFIVIGIAIIIFLVDVIFAHQGYIDSFLTSVAIAVAAIPESLPAVVTIILSIGVTKLAKKNAIIKKIHTVETLGCCQVICSDKTGTITQNKMTVQEVYVNDKIYTDSLNSLKQENIEILRCMVLCNDAKKQGEDYLGDSTETALIRYADKIKYDKQVIDKKHIRIGELPFDSNRKLMSTVNVVDEQFVQYTKGAIDELLNKCNYILINNKIRTLTKQDRQKIRNQNDLMCQKALRVLGFAYKKLEKTGNSNSYNNKIEENSLCFLGLAGMIDPPRPEVFDALKKCKSAGIKTIMITGDHKDTAYAIAKQLDMVKTKNQVINGSYLDNFSDKELVKEINKYNVFARVSPEHKVRIIKALKANGKIVAMTGDGVNDAPSIKCADIGIGMGAGGTDVTKKVSNMILSDDNFATIVVAVEEGRKVFGNIQKTIQFLLSCNIAEVIAIFLLTLLFPQYAFLSAVQILFINLITDTFPSIALGVDRAEKDIMNKPPRNPNQSIVGGRVGFDIVYQGVFQSLIVIGVYLMGIFSFKSKEVASTMAFLTLNFIQLFHMYNVHSNKSIFEDSPFKNKFINISFLIEIGLFIIISLLPTLSNILGMYPLSISQWAIVFLSSSMIIPICEIFKFFQNKRTKSYK